MTIALIMQGWRPETWEKAVRTVAPSQPVQVWPARMGDPAAVRYALVWRPPHGVLAGLPNLEVIFSLGAGVDYVLADPALPDVPLVRLVLDDMTKRMSEYVVWQVLHHHRQGPFIAANQRSSRWQPVEQWAASAVRVGVMGLGVLGEDSARKLAVMGFKVNGWSRTPKAIEGVTCYAGETEFDRFLAATDILMVLLPLTDKTAGVLNAALIGKLAKDGPLGGPVLINAGRGGLQVEADIIAALDSGALAGVSLDVFETEPLAPSSPLWRHPKVVVTPHIAADPYPRDIVAAILDHIARYERGEPLTDVVDRRRGY